MRRRWLLLAALVGAAALLVTAWIAPSNFRGAKITAPGPIGATRSSASAPAGSDTTAAALAVPAAGGAKRQTSAAAAPDRAGGAARSASAAVRPARSARPIVLFGYGGRTAPAPGRIGAAAPTVPAPADAAATAAPAPTDNLAPLRSSMRVSEFFVRSDPYPGWQRPNRYEPQFYTIVEASNGSAVPWKMGRGSVRFDRGIPAGTVLSYWSMAENAFVALPPTQTAVPVVYGDWTAITFNSNGRPSSQPLTVAPGEVAEARVLVSGSSGGGLWGDGIRRLPVEMTVALPAEADIGLPGLDEEGNPARLVVLSLSPAKQ